MAVKICPNCNQTNDADAYNCAQCGLDLFMVNAVEEELAPQPTPQSTPTPQSRAGRICSKCGQIKPIYMFSCDVCSTDLTTCRTVWISSGSLELNLLSGQRILTINEGEEKLIGHDHDLSNYFSGSYPFVSRAHAKIGLKNGEAYVIDNNSTNKVQVNGANIPTGQRYTLHDGDSLALGDTYNNNDSRAAHFTIKLIRG